MEDQDEFITRKSDSEDVALEANNKTTRLSWRIYDTTQTCIYRQSRGQYSNLDF